MPFSVVVPVHDEPGIGDFARHILAGMPAGAELVFVCNDCPPQCVEALRHAVAGRAKIVEILERSKSKAIRVGEANVTLYPRFFVDSDIDVSGTDLDRLSTRLAEENLELVSPRIGYQLQGASPLAAMLHGFAQTLPHLTSEGHHSVLGVSRAGRERWGEFPDLMADDTFIVSVIPPDRRATAPDIRIGVRPPRSLWSAIRVRERWERGHRQLRSSGISIPRTRGQRRAIMSKLLRPESCAPALLYISVRLIARFLSKLPAGPHWYRDRTTR